MCISKDLLRKVYSLWCSASANYYEEQYMHQGDEIHNNVDDIPLFS